MFTTFSEDDWVAATSDDLDFCEECHAQVDDCHCGQDPCLYCGRNWPTYDDFPYCSAECASVAARESEAA